VFPTQMPDDTSCRRSNEDIICSLQPITKKTPLAYPYNLVRASTAGAARELNACHPTQATISRAITETYFYQLPPALSVPSPPYIGCITTWQKPCFTGRIGGASMGAHSRTALHQVPLFQLHLGEATDDLIHLCNTKVALWW
jgi:hypothetical protein